jgi:ankyrin repeat protein
MRIRIIVSASVAALALAAAAHAQAIIDAARTGNRQAVRALITQKADVNATAVDGSTALLIAIDADDVETARLLLAAGADPKVANRYGVAPIMVAARNGNAALVEALIGAGADPSFANPGGETVLMTAVRSGNVATVRALLARGANPNVNEAWLDQTALMWAASDNQAPVMQALIEAGADLNARAKVLPGQPPRPRNSDTAFQAAHSNFPKGGFTPLLFAAQYGAMDAVGALADAKADLNLADPDGITPLMMATVNGHYDVAAELVRKGANVNAVDRSGRSALFFAVDMHTLEWLFSRPNPQPSGEMDSVDLTKLLLESGADPNARLTARGFILHHNASGNANLIGGSTPLMKAATTSDVVLMRMLIEHGADPNIATQNHTTPLMATAGLNWADISSLGSENETIEAMKLLIQHGADVNAFNDLGETALHGAAQRGADRVVQFLAEQGARLDAKDRRGRTPMDDAIGQASDTPAEVRNPERKSTQALLRQLMERRAGAR